MIVLGIDPGASGGLAIVSHAEGFPARVVETWKMPETPADVAMAVCEARDWHGVTFAMLEKVWAAPTQGRKQGAAGMFKFGQGFGHLEMALLCHSLPHQLVTPQKWQKYLGCMSGGDKNKTKKHAQALFPGTKVTLANADALLIAYYGGLIHQPSTPGA